MARLNDRLKIAIVVAWMVALVASTLLSLPSELTNAMALLLSPGIVLLIWSFDGEGRRSLGWVTLLLAWNAIAVYVNPLGLRLPMLLAGVAVAGLLIFHVPLIPRRRDEPPKSA